MQTRKAEAIREQAFDRIAVPAHEQLPGTRGILRARLD
jgi:hypothetical protein